MCCADRERIYRAENPFAEEAVRCTAVIRSIVERPAFIYLLFIDCLLSLATPCGNANRLR